MCSIGMRLVQYWNEAHNIITQISHAMLRINKEVTPLKLPLDPSQHMTYTDKGEYSVTTHFTSLFYHCRYNLGMPPSNRHAIYTRASPSL